MVVSSGSTPMAYVLSHINSFPSTCTGQRLFKFDPLLIRNIEWSLSIPSWGSLGLIFGRNDALLYAYSVYSLPLAAITLLDLNGNQKWS